MFTVNSTKSIHLLQGWRKYFLPQIWGFHKSNKIYRFTTSLLDQEAKRDHWSAFFRWKCPEPEGKKRATVQFVPCHPDTGLPLLTTFRPCRSFLPAQQLGTSTDSNGARKGEEEGNKDRADTFSCGWSSLGSPTTLTSRCGPGTTC